MGGNADLPIIENAAESIEFNGEPLAAPSPSPGAHDEDIVSPGGEEPVAEPEAKPETKPKAEPKGKAKAEAPKRPQGLDRLLSHYGEQKVDEPEPEPKTVEARFKQLTDRLAMLEHENTALRGRAGETPRAGKAVDLSAFDAKDLVSSIDLSSMDEGEAADFKERFVPALSQIASKMLDKYVTPLQEKLSQTESRFSELDQSRFQEEFVGYLADKWDPETEELTGRVLAKENLQTAPMIANNPRLSALLVLGIRSAFGLDELAGIKTAAEGDLRRKMTTTDTTPSRSSIAGGAPTRIMVGEELAAYKRAHGRD